ncbi:hypothetical protein CL621_00055 [archaeon]|nr:hypothetical protein [archaeon]|tara:strand:+ start:396 stop:599 length:204 start_codon:yes stop_codon:yes gene_type:complete
MVTDTEIKDCCFDCGREYLTEEQKNKNGVVTAWLGVCPICKRSTTLTSIRHFNYLKKANEIINKTNN